MQIYVVISVPIYSLSSNLHLTASFSLSLKTQTAVRVEWTALSGESSPKEKANPKAQPLLTVAVLAPETTNA